MQTFGHHDCIGNQAVVTLLICRITACLANCAIVVAAAAAISTWFGNGVVCARLAEGFVAGSVSL